jgi:purine-binding chemotaxis protein CheW
MQDFDTIETTRADAASDMANKVREFVVFGMGEEKYAVDIANVREIRSFTAFTPLPEAPSHVLGVVNLRGMVVPIMGLRERFGAAPVEPDRQTVVVMLEFELRTVGLVVDAVSDILRVDAVNIHPAPDYDSNTTPKGIEEMIIDNESLIGILSLGRVLGEVLEQAPIGEAA